MYLTKAWSYFQQKTTTKATGKWILTGLVHRRPKSKPVSSVIIERMQIPWSGNALLLGRLFPHKRQLTDGRYLRVTFLHALADHIISPASDGWIKPFGERWFPVALPFIIIRNLNINHQSVKSLYEHTSINVGLYFFFCPILKWPATGSLVGRCKFNLACPAWPTRLPSQQPSFFSPTIHCRLWHWRTSVSVNLLASNNTSGGHPA